MIITYKILLLPNKEQKVKLFNTLYVLRKYYNFCLDQKIRYYKSYGVGLPKYIQENMLPFLKQTDEWNSLKTIHSHLPQDALTRLDNAYDRFFKRLSGFPKFKNRDNYKSFTYKQPKNMNLFKTIGYLNLSKIGEIKIKSNIDVSKFKDNINTLNIKHENNKWYANITCEEDDIIPKDITSQVGIDVGIKSFIALSNGIYVENPKYLRQSELRLKRLQKQLSRKMKGSHNREKAKLKLSKLHLKVKNQQLTTKVASLKISSSVVALLLTAKATSMRKQGNIKEKISYTK